MTMELLDLSRRFAQLPAAKRKAFMARLRSEGLDFDALPMIPREPDAPAPLAPAQRALWLAWQRAPLSPAYNLAGRLRITGGLNAQTVQAALRRLVERHAVLRTRYALDANGSAVQVVQAEPVFGWTVCESAAASAEDHMQALLAESQAFAAQPFDLEQGHVFRGALHCFSDGVMELFVGVHHIAADGGSVELLLQELVSLLVDPAQAGLQEPPALQYADHALWQQRWLEAGELDRQLAYWREQLRDAPLATALPLDRPRGATRSARGELLTFSLAPELSAALAALARRHAASPYMVTVALLALLLHRYGGDHDLCIGVPSANRDRPELPGMVGHFTNVLVLRLRVDSAAGFGALLEQVRERLLDAKRHQELPLDLLIDALAVARSPGLNPLFQVKCAQQTAGPQRPRREAVQVAVHGIAVNELHFDLSLDVIEGGDRLAFQLAYATDLFDGVTIERLVRAFQQLAVQAAADPQRALSSTVLPGEPSLLRGEARAWPGDSVTALWAERALRHRDAPALIHGDRMRSHAELDAASERWAAHLERQGIGPESRVALLIERSSAFVLAMLAVLKTGAAFVPLDIGLPPQRLQDLLQDCGASLLLASAPLPWSTAVPVMCPSFDEMPPARAGSGRLPHPQQAAYVIYTSGSTGQPKGVVVSHGALANYVQGLLARLALPEGLRFAMVSTVAADLGHTALFGALCSGGSLLLFDSAQAFDPDAFASTMARHRIDVLKIVPSHLKGLLNAARPQDVLPAHTLVLGGETADAALLASVRELRPALRIVNHYGPTETTVGMLTHEADELGDALPLGCPIPNITACVLDDQLQPVPPGMVGELYVGGPGVARGYLGRAGLTASRFVASPFADGERLYRSGDRVRQRSDGRLSFLGRSDDQVKIRGFRVEPGELQGRLRQLVGVGDAAVVAGTGEQGGTALWAYVVPRVGALLETAQLRLELQHSLPAYLLPDAIMLLDALPLTANGKIDRQALPRPSRTEEATEGFEAPQGPTEQALARIWQDVLGVARVARSDDFFALGGDSILSLKLIARIRKQLPGGRGLALSEVMQATRLQDLAGRLQRRFETEHDAICLHAAGDGTPLYCLPGMIVNSREFLPLTEALGPTRPVYGFVSHVYTRERWRGFAIAALAAEYAAFIEASAPRGRCALLGWSSGGDLAFEVARQLQGRVAVDFLGMVDVFETEPLRPQRRLTNAQRALADTEIAAWLSRSTMAPRWHELFARMDDDERACLAEHVVSADQVLPLDGDGDDAAEYLLWATLDKRVQGSRYAYPRSATPVHVFHAEKSLQATGVLRDWAGCAPVVSTTIVPSANHLDIIRHPALMANLRQFLEQADR